MQVNHKDAFTRWLGVGIPLLTVFAVLAMAALHVAFGLPLSDILGPIGVFLLIQITIYVLMFWIRKRFSRTRDPRLAIAVFGAYCLAMGIVAFHYATKLKLLDIQKSEYITFSTVVALATVLLLAISPKWSADE